MPHNLYLRLREVFLSPPSHESLCSSGQSIFERHGQGRAEVSALQAVGLDLEIMLNYLQYEKMLAHLDAYAGQWGSRLPHKAACAVRSIQVGSLQDHKRWTRCGSRQA